MNCSNLFVLPVKDSLFSEQYRSISRYTLKALNKKNLKKVGILFVIFYLQIIKSIRGFIKKPANDYRVPVVSLHQLHSNTFRLCKRNIRV